MVLTVGWVGPEILASRTRQHCVEAWTVSGMVSNKFFSKVRKYKGETDIIQKHCCKDGGCTC